MDPARNGGTMLRLMLVALAEKGLSQKELAFQLDLDEAEVSRSFSAVNKIEKIMGFLGLYVERSTRERSLWTLANELSQALHINEELREQCQLLSEENLRIRQRFEALKKEMEKG